MVRQRTRIAAYGPSRSARSLSRRMGVLRLQRPGTSRFKPRSTDTIVNWGCTSQYDFGEAQVLNRAATTGATVDKKRFLMGCWTHPDINVPRWTTDAELAANFRRCVSRLTLRSSGGRGIVITEQGTLPPEAPLYVEYIPKQREYRIHVIGGQVVDWQRKIRDPDQTPRDWSIRSHANGFIFARETAAPSDSSLHMARCVVEHFALDFGAVDVIENRRGSWVLEVNTAPGLEGQTLETYVNGLKNLLTG